MSKENDTPSNEAPTTVPPNPTGGAAPDAARDQCETKPGGGIRAALSGGWPSRRRIRNALIGVGAALLIGGGGFFAGMLVADDSTEVKGLQDDVASVSSERDGNDQEADDLKEERDDLQERVGTLEEQVDAANNLKGSSGSSASANSSDVPVDVKLGQAARVGSLTLRLTSLERTSSSGATVTYQARITAKNDGSDSTGPFCGGDGAEMIDTDGRTFDGDSVIGDSSANCGDDLQPGLSSDNYVMQFKTPKGTKPAAVKLWGDYENEDSARTWGV